MSDLSIVFMGTPDFAVPTLRALHSSLGVSAVVTVPDKQKGRGRKVRASAVKKAALEMGLDILQPDSLDSDNFYDDLKKYNPDIICVVAFRILPEKIYSMANIASFNIHGSLLPKYRGAAPLNWAIINGESETGVTSFILDKKVDTGNIIGTKRTKIEKLMTAGELHDKLMPLSAELAVESVQMLVSGNFKTTKQDDSKATKAPKLYRKDAKINWDMPAEKVKNFINGMSPIPGAWFEHLGTTYKVFRAKVSQSLNKEVGNYLIKNDEFLIQTAEKTVSILEIQPEGRKRMPVENFIPGYKEAKEGIIT